MHIRVPIFLALSVLFLAQTVVALARAQSTTPPQDYVNEIMGLLRQHAITRERVDWSELRQKVDSLAKDAHTIEATYPAIKRAFELLDTNHTSLRTAKGQLVAYHSDLQCGEHIDRTIPKLEKVGYIRVNGFTSPDPWEKELFAFALQRKISEQDSADLHGWIIDLRWNTGGNMWPMIAGIGPLLGNGDYGYFINKHESRWGYLDGASVLNGKPIVTVASPYKLAYATPKIAVLSSNNTASSGEATLISFKQRDNVRVFGKNSCGQATANRTFRLSNGSQLHLTVSEMADKDKNTYSHGVNVDEEVPQDKIIAVAVQWLKQSGE
ncbi:S41 family peptidase [Planctobacterium marinum]|uniref:S41 family peptidase n=1 Tax=Planctobacterium marinum TaxID=1631968 RepID=UPI001E5FFEF9|nr:S41 family peptidase [Planctobacterium marinum]MCC2607008.1 S41 family peptidase [Planctobacterium marinum]